MIIMDLIMLKAAPKLSLLFKPTGLWREGLGDRQKDRRHINSSEVGKSIFL
jgi:hypothetical protein